jgi:creatinine amidohydrolase
MMRFEDLNWFDVEKYLSRDDRLMVVLGACEQHGYLSLLTDVHIPMALADAAARKSGVLLAPPVNYGSSPYFLEYPGTISLRISTLLDLGEDLVRSIYRQGFRRILFINGHGGNDPLRLRLYELAGELPGARFAWYAWWQSQSVEAIAVKYDLPRAHANWMEAFPFTRVAELPQGEKIPPKVPGLVSPEEAKAVYGDGVFGGPYQAGEEVMNEIFTVCLADILHLLEFNT